MLNHETIGQHGIIHSKNRLHKFAFITFLRQNKKKFSRKKTLDNYFLQHDFKGTATLYTCESNIQALIKPCNLPQTQSKSDMK